MTSNRRPTQHTQSITTTKAMKIQSTTRFKSTSTRGPWSSWSQCTVTCGVGKQRRFRSDGMYQIQDCNLNKCRSSSTSQIVNYKNYNNDDNVQFTSRSRNFMNPTVPKKKSYTTLHDWFFDWAKNALNI